MKKIIIVLTVLAGVYPQHLDDIQINIYPEYYYFGIMVELEATIESVNESESITMTLPAEADSVFLIKGVPGPTSEVIPLNIQTGDPYASISFDISESQFRLFVFYNPFAVGHDKQFTWTVGSDKAMRNVHMAVQVPIMAEQFSLSVQAESEEHDQHGILFKKIHMGDIEAHSVKSISASYLNYTGFTTMENLRAQLEMPQAPEVEHAIKEEKPIRHTLLVWEPLAILGVLFLIIGVLFYKNQQNDDGKNYCASCGNAIETTNKFCSNCGEKIQ